MPENDSKRPYYPWAELYNIESGSEDSQISSKREGPGRPPSIVKRHNVTITLTDDEIKIFNRLDYILGRDLYPNKITKSQVVGFALRYLLGSYEKLSETPSDWNQLVELLFDPTADEAVK